MWAAAEGHAPVVRALIEAGEAIDATLDSGFTPFFFAPREGRIEARRALLEKGDRRQRADTAAGRGRPEGANPQPYILNRPIPRGTSPLLIAVQNGHFELALALVDAGASRTTCGRDSRRRHLSAGVRKPDSSDGSDPSRPRARDADEPSIRSRAREAGRERQYASRQGRTEVPATSSRSGRRGDAVSSGRRLLRRPVDAAAARAGRRPMLPNSATRRR